MLYIHKLILETGAAQLIVKKKIPISIHTYMQSQFSMTAIHLHVFPCTFRSCCIHINLFTYSNPICHISHTHTIKKTNMQLNQPDISQWFSHTTQSPLLFLFLFYGATLSVTVAAVTRHGVCSLTCTQAGKRQKSVDLELEPHFTSERKNSCAIQENSGGDSETDNVLVPIKDKNSTTWNWWNMTTLNKE